MLQYKQRRRSDSNVLFNHVVNQFLGIGDTISLDELNIISSDPNNDFVLFVANFTELASIEGQVAKTTCAGN